MGRELGGREKRVTGAPGAGPAGPGHSRAGGPELGMWDGAAGLRAGLRMKPAPLTFHLDTKGSAADTGFCERTFQNWGKA